MIMMYANTFNCPSLQTLIEMDKSEKGQWLIPVLETREESKKLNIMQQDGDNEHVQLQFFFFSSVWKFSLPTGMVSGAGSHVLY